MGMPLKVVQSPEASTNDTLGAVFGAKSSAKGVTDLRGAMISKRGAMVSKGECDD